MGQEKIDQEEIDQDDQEAIDRILRVLIRAFFIGIGLFFVQDLSQIQFISGDPAINSIGTGTISLLLSIIIQKCISSL
jgi:hypothetical protein